MANVELLDSLLVKSKCKQSLSSASCSSSVSCSSSSSCSTSNCPKEEEICCKCPPQLECCTPQYLRLSKLSTAYLLENMGAHITDDPAVDRTGTESTFSDEDLSSNTLIAYRFVWASRYLPMEQCKEDQVWGWEVNLNTGDLRLLQDVEHATMNTTRGELLNIAVEDLSLNQRKALKMLNNLYKMSEHASKCLT